MKKQFMSVLLSGLLLAGCAGGTPSVSITEPSNAATEQATQEAIVELSSEVSGEITVACYDTMQYQSLLETAAAAFEGKYPGTKVNVETFSEMPEIKTQESDKGSMVMIQMDDQDQAINDYISKVNTEIMSGGGADVLALDVIPWYKYADNGHLSDLSSFMNSDAEFDKSAYPSNILNAFLYKSKQYAFPMDYTFDYLAYDSSLFTDEEAEALTQSGSYNYKGIVNLALEAFNRVNQDAVEPTRIFGTTNDTLRGPSMFNNLLMENYYSFIDMENKVVNLADGRFEELLNTAKEYQTNGYINQSAASGPLTMDSFSEQNNTRYFYKTKTNFNLLLNYINTGENKFMFRTVGSGSGNEDDDKTLGLIEGSGGEISFDSSLVFGINANSKNQRLAWEFIKFMAQEEIQTSMLLPTMNLPIHNESREKMAKAGFTGELMSRGMSGKTGSAGGSAPAASGELTEEQLTNLNEYLNLINSYTTRLNTYYIQDNTIDNLIKEEAANFFNGTKTAAEVASTLQNKIDLYLNE